MTILGPIPPRLPIGLSDYEELRSEGYTFVDKTAFIAEVLDSDAKSLRIPRPRRFGKTLNVSMLRRFLERDPERDRSAIFDDTHVWRAGDGRYRAHFQRYPVIALSFKDVKAPTWEDAWASIRRLIVDEVDRLHATGHVVAETSGEIDSSARLSGGGERPNDYSDALQQLARWARRATGERVVILIDEYDTPLHAAWQYGYWDDALAFFRPFLSGGLKDHPDVFRATLTGILKVAKEGIFSGLNNVRTYGLLQSTMVDAFGFTDSEVGALADRAGCPEDKALLREWYDGYRFGGLNPVTLYNPWSVLMYLSAPQDGAQSYWKNTSSNDLVHSLLLRHAGAVGVDVAALLRGESIPAVIDENVALQHIGDRPADLWSLLTFSGYLTPESAEPTRNGARVRLRIPNQEVFAVYEDSFSAVFRASPSGAVDALVSAMLSGEVSEFERQLSRVLQTVMSYHDFAGRAVEAVYQAFIVGLLVHLEATHVVRSNREAGYGRADVLITPRRPGAGAVLELKTVDKEFGDTIEGALDSALSQLRDREYASELRAAGATSVEQFGIVFDGKRCYVRRVEGDG